MYKYDIYDINVYVFGFHYICTLDILGNRITLRRISTLSDCQTIVQTVDTHTREGKKWNGILDSTWKLMYWQHRQRRHDKIGLFQLIEEKKTTTTDISLLCCVLLRGKLAFRGILLLINTYISCILPRIGATKKRKIQLLFVRNRIKMALAQFNRRLIFMLTHLN